MRIANIREIYDNGEFVTVVTITGVAVNLPKGEHVLTVEQNGGTIYIDFDQ